MFKKVYLFALAGLLGLSACQRSMVGGFQASHTEPTAHPVVKTAAQKAESASPSDSELDQLPVAAPSVATLPAPVAPVMDAPAATPEKVAQLSDQLVASAKGTKYEARTQKLKAILDKAETQSQVNANAAPRKLNFAEKMMTKMVTKKINKQVKDAQQANKTQRLDSNVGLGILFLAVALILALLNVGSIYVVIAAVLGVAFLIIGLLNQAAS